MLGATHAYCSFVLLNKAIPIVSGYQCAHALLIIRLFYYSIRFTGKKIQRVKIVVPKWRPNFSARPLQIMWHTGDFYVANKEIKNVV